jgi:hypothetical protein
MRRDCRKPVGEYFTRMHKIVVGLEIQPEFGFHSKKYSQPSRGIRRDGAPPRYDLADPALRHSNFLGQTVLCHAQGFEKFFDQDFTQGRQWNLTLCHDSCSPMVIDDLDIPSRPIAPHEAETELVVGVK